MGKKTRRVFPRKSYALSRTPRSFCAEHVRCALRGSRHGVACGVPTWFILLSSRRILHRTPTPTPCARGWRVLRGDFRVTWGSNSLPRCCSSRSGGGTQGLRPWLPFLRLSFLVYGDVMSLRKGFENKRKGFEDSLNITRVHDQIKRHCPCYSLLKDVLFHAFQLIYTMFSTITCGAIYGLVRHLRP